jgi:hypothetical protein
MVLGAVRGPTASPTAPAQFALSLKAGETPMIVDVTADDALGPVASTGDRFLTFVTQPTGTSIWASANGSLWAEELTPDKLVTATNNGRPVVLDAIGDGHGGAIAVGRVTSATGDTGTIWHLAKGGSWHQATLQDTAPPEFSSVVAGTNGFVASADKSGGSTVMYSNDGESWSASAIQVSSNYALTVNTYQYGFVAVGSDSTRQGVSTAWTSPDGRTWTARTDWSLPVNVTQLFGMGTGLVALTNGSGLAPAGTSTASAAAPAKPSPTAVVASATSTWWWSATGVTWKPSGMAISGNNWAMSNGRIFALSAPSTPAGSWTVWSSPDGESWQPQSSGLITFPGSMTCQIASSGSSVVIVGWQAAGQLKDYFGTFAAS